jgi:hypothetical protein
MSIRSFNTLNSYILHDPEMFSLCRASIYIQAVWLAYLPLVKIINPILSILILKSFTFQMDCTKLRNGESFSQIKQVHD